MKKAHARGRGIIAPTILLVCMLLAWCPRAFALDPALDINQYAHTSWKFRDGFTKGNINSIAQTPDGYLWLGTQFGLLRFDGVRTVAWDPPPDQHLPSSEIIHLRVARDGRLWIGTSKGLTSWKDGKLTEYPEFAGKRIVRLLEDREDSVWVSARAISGGTLCSIRNGSVQCFGEVSSLGQGPMGLYEDSKGTLWAGMASGLWRWKPGSPKFYPVPDQPSLDIQSMAEDEDGALLIAKKSGIGRLIDGKIEPHLLPGPVRQFAAHRLLRDRDGGLWIGASGQGLVHLHHGRTDGFSVSDGLSGDSIYSIFEDREGSIWVATNGGLDRFREFAVPTFSVSQGLSGAAVMSVLADKDGSVWLANDGLNRWKNGSIITFDGRAGKLNGSAPNSLFQDASGRIWVSTSRAFGYLESDRFIPVRGFPDGYAHAIAEDAAGNLWIANQDTGLFQLFRGNVVQQLPWARLGHKDFAIALAADPLRGGLWLGFFEGGIVYFNNGHVGAAYSAADGLGEGNVSHLRLERDGTLWAATGGGLSRLKDGRIATLRTSNGLPCEGVQWMVEDDAHSLWLNTPCGLVRIVSSELDAWQSDPKRTIRATVFDNSDGVRSRPIGGGLGPQVTKSSDGKLWFRTLDGVSVIDPQQLHINTLPPPVQIEQITGDRKTYTATSDPNGRLPLPALLRDLAIDYTALSLAAPEKMRFRYKLENHDGDWVDAGTRRQAFYNDLAPGNYRFRVIASNNSGVWNETGASLDFSVAPAYYQTTWFRVSIAIVALTLLATLYQMRLRYLARQFNMRTEERVRERTRIARDLHDTLLQSFQGLLLRFHSVTYLLPDRPDEARNTLESVIEQARTAINEGRDAVQGLRAPAVLNDLARAIGALGEELCADYVGEAAPDFLVLVEGTVRGLSSIPRDEAYRIAIEALRNAFRHANAKRIEVEIDYGLRQFCLRIRDDGKGIDPAVLRTRGVDGHYGMTGMHERANSVGGKLAVWSELDSGTEVELVIPGAIAYAKSSAASSDSKKS